MILEAFRLAPNCDKNGDGGGGGGSVLVSTGEMSCALGTLDSAGTNELPRHAPRRFSHTDASCAVSHAIKI